jgi:hypothetical protein
MVECGMGVALVPQALAKTESQQAVFVRFERNPFSSQILTLTQTGSQSANVGSFLSALK